MNRSIRAIRFTFMGILASNFVLSACGQAESSEVAQQSSAALSSASDSASVVLSSLSSVTNELRPGTIHRPVTQAPRLAPTTLQARPLAAAPLSAAAPSAAPAAPNVTFEGQEDTGWAPPDTNGAVSSQFAVTTVNNRITVRNRSGAVATTADLNAFWSSVSSPGNSFDTRIRFDPYGQRFIMISAGSLNDIPNSSLLIAVTKTSDPTGQWYQYRIKADPQSLTWLDHPTIGFNKKWIVVSGNMIGADTKLWVFNKAQLYAGSNTYRVLPGVGWTTQPAETYDPNLEDLYMLRQNGDTGVVLYKVTGSVGSETVQTVASVAAPQTWTQSPQAPQAGSAQLLDTGEDWLLDAVYRNGSVWATDTVQPNSGPTRSAVQWWRVSTAGALQDFGRIDDPTGVAYYGMSSIAVNKNNDALVGFTRFSADTFPSAAYAFRLSGDAPGTFRSPLVYKAGLGPYASGDRWGDYSHTQVDPVNDTDIWTIQEYSRGATGWDTWWAGVTPSSSSCSSNADCDDHVFCNGAEKCVSSACVAGVSWGSACFNATPLSRYQNSGFLGTGERWFVVTEEPNGWQATNVTGRQIRVNGVLVTPGQMPLPAKVDGKRYFQFTAGSLNYASWSFW